MAGTVEYHFEYGFRILKTGKPGKTYGVIAVTRICPLAHCEKCGRVGSPAWVRHWWMRPNGIMSDREYEYYDDPEPRLCMGCMNRMRPFWTTQQHIKESRKLISRIKMEITRVNSSNSR